MAEKTEFLKLTKPSQDDFYDISVQNENMDIIDQKLHEQQGQIEGFQYGLDEKSPIDHDHDGVYSPVGHNHDGKYSPTGHNHDGQYAPAYSYGTDDLTAGVTPLASGKLHFVYE